MGICACLSGAVHMRCTYLPSDLQAHKQLWCACVVHSRAVIYEHGQQWAHALARPVARKRVVFTCADMCLYFLWCSNAVRNCNCMQWCACYSKNWHMLCMLLQNCILCCACYSKNCILWCTCYSKNCMLWCACYSKNWHMPCMMATFSSLCGVIKCVLRCTYIHVPLCVTGSFVQIWSDTFGFQGHLQENYPVSAHTFLNLLFHNVLFPYTTVYTLLYISPAHKLVTYPL